MVYTRFIEAGRVCLVANGKLQGNIVVVSDIVDQKRALCENPVHKIPRQIIRMQDITLTDLTIDITHGANTGVVAKQYIKAEIDSKWEKNSYAQKLKQQALKKTLTDFDRFKGKVAKQQKNRKIQAIVK